MTSAPKETMPEKEVSSLRRFYQLQNNGLKSLFLLPPFAIVLAIIAGLVIYNSIAWAEARGTPMRIALGASAFLLLVLAFVIAAFAIVFSLLNFSGESRGIIYGLRAEMRASIDPILTLPEKARRKTLLFMVPIFAMFDVALAIVAVTLTQVSLYIWGSSISLVTRTSIVISEFVLFIGMLLFGYLHVLYSRWVMNRRVI